MAVRVTTLASNSPATLRSAANGELSDVVVNGVSFTDGDGNLSVGGTDWSLTIPLGNALRVGKYNVAASSTDAAGNTGSDSTTNELVLVPNVVINEVDADTPSHDDKEP